MRLKERAHVFADAWFAFDRVQIEIAKVRLTATPDEAVEFAHQLLAAAQQANELRVQHERTEERSADGQ